MPLKNLKKPSDRIRARKNGIRLKRSLTARNIRAIEYGSVLQQGLETFLAAISAQSDQMDWNNPVDQDQIRRAVEKIFDRWVNSVPDKCWSWLKNRSRFKYELVLDVEGNRIEFIANADTRRFVNGQLNDFGEIVAEKHLQAWDEANKKEAQDVPTTQAPGG